MSGDRYKENEARIEEIIRTINIGIITQEAANKLRFEAERLLVENRKILEKGEGQVFLVSIQGKKVVEKELVL
ncbi:MAG: hypothetical protein KAR56_00335 [Thermoplasmata archaeon]|nr:hypothetical protein [Thermoplasmata archaeon]